MNKLPHKLLQLRKHYGYSQSYVAEQLGISALDYMGFENGRAVPSFSQLKLLARFFKINVIDLFDNSVELNLENKRKASVDKKNMAYLNKISKAEKRRVFFEKNGKKVKLACALVCVILILLYGVGTYVEIINTAILEKIDRVDNRFSASDTTTVYIDNNGEVKGLGDNANGQLNNLPKDAFKVVEADTFTATLLKDGTIKINGLIAADIREEIESLNRIVDIAAGNGHLLALSDRQVLHCFGNGGLGQCEFDGRRDVNRIFASANASFILNLDGNLEYSGDFIGKSKLKYVNNIIDIEANEYILAYITSDNKVVVHSLFGDFSQVEEWSDIVDIAIGKDFVAALNKDREVLIASDNELTKAQVGTFGKVQALSSGIDFISVYNGQEVLGAGNNAYKQFKENEIQKLKLDAIKNPKIDLKEDRLVISFDYVEHATTYELLIDEVSKEKSNKNSFEISFEDLEDNSEYVFGIIAKGEGIYEDSDVARLKFIFKDPNKVPGAEEEVTIGPIIGMEKKAFEDYILGLGADRINFKSTEANKKCKEDQVIILDVKGIKEGDIFKRKDLANKTIEYSYCKYEKKDQDVEHDKDVED